MQPLLETFSQTVEALRHLFAGCEREVLRSLVDLDTGQDSLAGEQFGNRGPVRGRLPDGFVEQDHTTDEFFGSLGGEEHLAVGEAIFFGGFDLDRVESLLDGGRTLVGRENSLAGGHHGPRDIG
jgi:hypothetical protein